VSPSTGAGTRLGPLRRRARRVLLRNRRPLAAALLGVAVLVAVGAARPAPPATVAMTVAARDLTGGHRLAAGDVETVRADPDLVPDGALPPDLVPLGRLVAGPVRAGEPLTDAALAGPGLAAQLTTGEVLTTVHVRDPAADLVASGDVVTVLATDPRSPSSARVVAEQATVVTVPEPDPAAMAGGSTGGTTPLVLAVPESTALALGAAATTSVLDIWVPAPP